MMFIHLNIIYSDFIQFIYFL